MNSAVKSLNLLRSEFRSLGMFLFNTDKKIMEIVFFSTQAQYVSYYQGLLDELVETRKKTVVYLTADEADLKLSGQGGKILLYYSKSFLPLIFPTIDSPVLVTTIPDLNQYQINRSFLGTNYVYTFHSLVSTHVMYRKGAFDFYDTIFCAGPYHAAEIRRTEQAYNLPQKTLHEVGYYRLEKIYDEHQTRRAEKQETPRKLALIAPGWQDSNILDTCADELIDSLLAEDFEVVFRPHPMTIRNAPQKLQRLREKYAGESRFRVDVETSSEKYLHSADVMICDWSGVALEYAFGTERPVLFVDLPQKIYNSEYEKIGIVPLEVRIRDQIGKSIQPQEAKSAGKLAMQFITRQPEYREQIIAARQEHISNFGNSRKVGGEIIQDILDRGIKGRMKP